MRNRSSELLDEQWVSNRAAALVHELCLLVMLCLLALLCETRHGFAAEGSGKRLAVWNRLPAKIVSKSGGGLELQITNTDSVLKFCDLHLAYRLVNQQADEKVEHVYSGFEFETDATQSFQFPDRVAHTDVADSSVYANLACIAIAAGERTDVLRPAAGCIAQNADCDNLCLNSVSSSGVDRCVQRKSVFSKPEFDVSGEPATPMLKVVLANDATQDLRCGGGLGLRAYKPGTTSSIQWSEDISNVEVAKTVGSFALQLKRSRLGAGYLFDFSTIRLALSCIESNTASLKTLRLWNIGKMAEPETKTELDWLSQ